MKFCSLGVFLTSCTAFHVPLFEKQIHRPSRTSALFLQQQGEPSSPVEEMRQDISRLEQEAAERLQNLMDQMDDLVDFEESVSVGGPSIINAGVVPPNDVTVHHIPEDTQESIHQHDIESSENDPQKQTSLRKPSEDADDDRNNKAPTSKKHTNSSTLAPPKMAPLDLLTGTSWRLVFNIGREEGTWMPKEWGSSGDRLRLECKVRFTNTTVAKMNDGGDDFFHPKPFRLDVSEGYLWPTGVGVGRKPLRIGNDEGLEEALFQIVPGTDQGDVLRMRIPLAESVNRSDVTCPSGNLYVTANYYGLPEWHCRMRDQALHEWTKAQATLEMAETKLQEAKQAAEENSLGWFGLWKPMADVWKAKHTLEEHQAKYVEAQHRFPEKSHLRFDDKERVALSREGGLCLKIHSGVAIEYHILGRVEIGCADKKKIPSSPDHASV